jgi:hypothetical protein
VAQDDTVGFGYFSLLESVGGEVPAPDIVVSSLSKVFSGVGNAMGGALTLNAMSPNYGELKALMDEQFELMLAEADAGKCDLEAFSLPLIACNPPGLRATDKDWLCLLLENPASSEVQQ